RRSSDLFSIRDQYKRRYASSEIEQGVDFHGSPRVLSRGPLKKHQAKGNRSRVQCENLILQLYVGYRMIGVHRAYCTDQIFSEVCKYPPIPTLISTRQ